MGTYSVSSITRMPVAQCQPCLRILTARSLVSATAYNEVGCSGDHARDPIAIAVAIDTGS